MNSIIFINKSPSEVMFLIFEFKVFFRGMRSDCQFSIKSKTTEGYSAAICFP